MDSAKSSARIPETDRRLLEFLVCPLTRGPLRWDPDRQELVSASARIAYPVRGGIPIMLASEARKLEDE
jgi:uncharacterized protein YbaR (Trm112 family)